LALTPRRFIGGMLMMRKLLLLKIFDGAPPYIFTESGQLIEH